MDNAPFTPKSNSSHSTNHQIPLGKLILGRSGTGKTTEILSIPESHGLHPHEFLYLSVQKHQRFLQRNRLPEYLEDRIHTVASYAHSLITESIDSSNLPEEKDVYEYSSSEQKALSTYFQTVFDHARSILPELDRFNLGFLKVIAIDDFEALGDSQMAFISELLSYSNAQVVIAGDPARFFSDDTIQHPESAYLSRAHALFASAGIDEWERQDLHTDYRSPGTVHDVAQFFLSSAEAQADTHERPLDLDSANWHTPQSNSHNRRTPHIHFFSDRDAEYRYLLREITRITKRSILVQSHRRSDVKWLRNRLKADGIQLDHRIHVETINRATPVEADNVFIFEATFPAEHASAPITPYLRLYSAVSRGTRRVEILSAHPSSSLTSHSRYGELESLVEVVNAQKALHKPFTRLPRIDPSKKMNFRQSKLHTSSIDSIDLAVSGRDAPFIPLVPSYLKLAPKQPQPFIHEYVDEYHSMPVGIRRTRDHHTFQFRDLSAYKKKGYSDVQIVKAVVNYIFSYFDYRIPASAITVKRIDLARYVFDEAPDESLRSDLGLLRETQPQSIYHVGSRRGEPFKDRFETLDSLVEMGTAAVDHAGIYVNYSSQPAHSVTVRMYRPQDKQNRNRINIAGYKFELQLRGKKIEREYALGDLQRLDRLIDGLDSGEVDLKTVMARVLNHFHRPSPTTEHEETTIERYVPQHIWRLIGIARDLLGERMQRRMHEYEDARGKRKQRSSIQHARDPPMRWAERKVGLSGENGGSLANPRDCT